MNSLYQLTKDIHFLGKFRVFPKIILIMILEDESNIFLSCIRQARFDTLRSKTDAFINGKFRSSLPRQYTAIGTTQLIDHIDPFLLFEDFILPKIFIWMCKIRRAAQHWNLFPFILHFTSENF